MVARGAGITGFYRRRYVHFSDDVPIYYLVFSIKFDIFILNDFSEFLFLQKNCEILKTRKPYLRTVNNIRKYMKCIYI